MACALVAHFSFHEAPFPLEQVSTDRLACRRCSLWYEQDPLQVFGETLCLCTLHCEVPDFKHDCSPRKMVGSLEHRWSSHFIRVFCSNARGYRSHNTSGNLCGLHRLALRQLKQSQFSFLALDTSPGYAVVAVDQHYDAESPALQERFYTPVVSSSLNLRTATLEYRAIASKIARLESASEPDYRLSHTICSSVSSGYYVAHLASL
jgi:hypothetical protein